MCDKRFLARTRPRLDQLLWEHFKESHPLEFGAKAFYRLIREKAVVMVISRKVYEEYQLFWNIPEYWKGVRKQPIEIP